MSSTKKLKFFKTIRFKLTLLYSVIVFIFCGILVLFLNVYLNNYLNSDPIFRKTPDTLLIQRFPGPNVIINFDQLQDEERAVVRAIRQNDLDQIRMLSLYALFPIAVLSFALGYLVSGRFLDPINKLKKNIDTLTRTDLGKKIPVDVEDEVGGLIMSFNELSERLKNSFEVQECFVQDASHELKTPLTIIQTNLDTVIDDPTATEQELKIAITKALSGVKELRNLTNYLLELTVNQEFEFNKINFEELIKAQVEKLKQISINKGINLSFKKDKISTEELFVMADENTLGRSIFNIIENAIKYYDPKLTPGESFVKVVLAQDQSNAILKIIDNGVGIPKDLQNKIFERFFRIEKSRNKKLGGFGLGLSISKKIIEDLDGQIAVSSEIDSLIGEKETIFTIKIPLLKK